MGGICDQVREGMHEEISLQLCRKVLEDGISGIVILSGNSTNFPICALLKFLKQ